MKSTKFATVDNYIAGAVPAAQPILTALRELIKNTFPDCLERIWYNVPYYKTTNGDIGGLSVAKHHVTLGFAGEDLSAEMRAKFTKLGYKTGKKTLQIAFTQPVPYQMIKAVLLELNS